MENFPEIGTSRVMGTEMEWAIMVRRDGKVEPLDYNGAISILEQIQTHPYVVPGNDNQPMASMGYNGSGRWYKDVGDHIESTTSEDTSVIGTAANEAVTADMLYEAVLKAKAARALAAEKGERDVNKKLITPLCDDFAIYKTVRDDKGERWGYHISTLVSHTVSLTESGLSIMGLHLATSPIYAGAGAWLPDGRFSLSQKALATNMDFSGSTTDRSTPLVNLRNEPHSNEYYKRLHITSADPHISPEETILTIGTIGLVSGLIERGIAFPRLQFAPNSLYKIAHQTSLDFTMKKTAQTMLGSHYTPLQIQMELCEAAGRLDLTPEEAWIQRLWAARLALLEHDPFAAARGTWTTRYLLGKRTLAALQEEQRKETDPEKILSPEEIYAEMRRKNRGMLRISTPEQNRLLRAKYYKHINPDTFEALVEQRQTEPARTTRAWDRARLIKEAKRQSIPVQASWTTVKKGSNPKSFLNPFADKPAR